MNKISKPVQTTRKSIVKLLIASIILVAMVLACFSDIDRELIGLIVMIIFLLVLPSTVLLSIDAGRAIGHQSKQSKSTKALGKLLGFPLAILGCVLVAIGVIYPFVGIYNFVIQLSMGKFVLLPLVMTVISIFMLGVGFYYIREWLGLDKKIDSDESNPG